MYAVFFKRFSYLVCAVFPLVPDWNGRFASQNRKMTRTLPLRFVAVCRLLRAVFLFGLRRFSRSSRTRRTFCFAKPKNDAHPASPICGCMPSSSSGFLIWSAPFFPLVPDWDGRFASQNRKMTRTPHLKYAFLIVITWEARLLLHTYGLYLCCDNLLKQKISF